MFRSLRLVLLRRRRAVRTGLLLLAACLLLVALFSSKLPSRQPPSSIAARGEREASQDVRALPAVGRQHKHTIADYSVRRSGPGENGRPVYLSGAEKEAGEADMKKWFMNVVASDKISLDRSIPDTRAAACKSVVYDRSSLPTASVVIIYTNEAWSPLLRTVHSVINRSPPELLHEIVLLDDNSDRDELGSKLDRYIERFGEKVKLVRKTERQGLIRARLEGAKAATGDVLVFLDSHCEANAGWLEPLLQRVKEKRNAILCPTIDMISDHTIGYFGGGAHSVGSFWWSLHFSWKSIPEREHRRRKSDIEPILSPTMAGGLFAADRKYFFEIGGYDEGMDIWGGENLELSFRTWMCGGSLEFIPCSRVGHIFRSGHPYNMTGRGGNKDVHGVNSARLAEVWMDDYKRLYYLHRSDLKSKDIGDLSQRKSLRAKLKCHSFKWYLDNVIPEKFVPDENVKAYGMLRNPSTGLCLDTLQKDEKGSIDIGVFSCQGGGSSAQVFSLTHDGQLRREESCSLAGSNFLSVAVGGATVVKLQSCQPNSEPQKWKHDRSDGSVVHVSSNLCLDVEGLSNTDNVLLKNCERGKAAQQWEFANYPPVA